MGIERRYSAFNVVNDEGDIVDTFFCNGSTLWDARHAESGEYPGCTIEAVVDTLIPLTDSELTEIARENELKKVVDSEGNIYFISDDTDVSDTVYDALHIALDNMGVDLDTYGEVE